MIGCIALNPPFSFATVTKHSGHTGPVTVVVSPLVSLMEDQVREGVTMVDIQPAARLDTAAVCSALCGRCVGWIEAT